MSFHQHIENPQGVKSIMKSLKLKTSFFTEIHIMKVETSCNQVHLHDESVKTLF